MKWLSHLLSLVLAALVVCGSAGAVMGTDGPQAKKAVASDEPSTNNPPMVIQNQDGTITVQKQPPKQAAKDTNAKKGLVIPPQVVVPIVRTSEKRN